MADTKVRLVLLETSGNQRFIFDTNKIREVIGASEMVYQAGTRLVLEAVAKKRTIGLSDEDWNTPDGLRRFLLDPKKNLPIKEQGDPRTAVEIIVATSGKALLLVQDEKVGTWIVEHVTRAALTRLPGLTIRGVVGDEFVLKIGDAATEDDAKLFDERIKAVHKALAALGADVPGAETRFPRLPVVAPCETSGLPAAQVRIWTGKDGTPRSDERPTRLSAVSAIKGGYFAKRNQKRPKGFPEKGWRRVRDSLPAHLQKCLAETVEDLEKRVSGRREMPEDDENQPVDGDRETPPGDGLIWLSVIHADGNGLGQIFLNFGSILTETLGDEANGRSYITHMRNFSLALDICTVNAFAMALKKTVQFDKNNKPSAVVVPVILGGDDLTVLCDGRIAIKFAEIFLDEFEKQTGRKDLCPLVSQKEENPADNTAQTDVQDIIPMIATQADALAVPHLSACAGVAIVKGHFPFHQAYHLAEALLKSAKKTKAWTAPAGQLSALDYHVLYDASGADLERIRERLTTVKPKRGDEPKIEVRHFARPYIVTPLDDAIAALGGEDVRQMVETRHWQALENAILTLSAIAGEGASGDPERKERLSRTLQHDLRSALFEGQNAAEARLKLIQGRISKSAFKSLLIDDGIFGNLPEFQGGASKPVSDDNSVVYATRLLDAMDIVEFWQGA